MLPKVKQIFIIALTLTGVVFGWIGYGILQLFYPDEYSPYFPLIPLFFYVFGLVFIYLFEYMHKYMPEKSTLVYIISKGAKLVIGLMFLVVYGFFIGIHTKVFILTFLAYYIVYLIFESCFFLRFEMEMKKENKKK